MKNSQTKIMVMIAIIFLVGTGAGYFFGQNHAANNPSTPVPIPNYTFEPQPSSSNNNLRGEDQIACTQDVKECPDGSFVGRSGPNCEFLPCPGN